MASYKRDRGFGLGATEKQMVRAGLEPGNAGLRVRHADHSAALTPDRYALCVVITFTALVIAEL